MVRSPGDSTTLTAASDASPTRTRRHTEVEGGGILFFLFLLNKRITTMAHSAFKDPQRRANNYRPPGMARTGVPSRLGIRGGHGTGQTVADPQICGDR